MSLELARQQWQDGARRLREAARDPAEERALIAIAEVLIVELRRRVGGIFTLSELADEYDRVDGWALDHVAENAPVAGWQRSLSVAQDLAFHAYARGAQDYAP